MTQIAEDWGADLGQKWAMAVLEVVGVTEVSATWVVLNPRMSLHS